MNDDGRPASDDATNRAFWDADADDYQAVHSPTLRGATWGVWSIAEDAIGALGPVSALDVLELGCGAAQWSIALARQGARVVGLDQSRGQLRHARAAVAAQATVEPASPAVRLVCASAVATPFAAASFDVVMCDHGAMSFCDPYLTVPEVARVLRPGGRLVFSHATAWHYLAWDDARDRISRKLRRPYFGIHRFGNDGGTVDFQLEYGAWIRLFRANGLVVDDLVELRAPADAGTTFVDFEAKWARRWPAEQIWSVRRD